VILTAASTLACGGWVNRPLADDSSPDTPAAPASNTGEGSESSSDERPPDDDSDDSDAGSDCTFVCEDADCTICGVGCDIWSEADCPEGEKCTAVACEVGSNSWDMNVCKPIGGAAEIGEPCTYLPQSWVSGEDTCAPGGMCWDMDADTGEGMCVEFCKGSPEDPQCGPDTICAIFNDGVLPLCMSTCDPIGQDCEGDQACLPDESGAGFICVLSTGTGAPYGTPCNYVNSCNPGLLCIDAAAVPESECEGAWGCCSPLCDLQSGESCPGEGQACLPFYPLDVTPPGYEDVGVCQLP
jgi:hypothetical protein